MGGCRCTFRECKHSSLNSPSMHFFHFPYKNMDRCRKWAQNAEKMDFLSLPVNKLRNKVVCEEHFTESSFMNYRRERLIKTAIPTLYRNSNGSITDCDTTETDDDNLDFEEVHVNSIKIDIDLPNNNGTLSEGVVDAPRYEETVVGKMFEEWVDADTNSTTVAENTVEIIPAKKSTYNVKIGQSTITPTSKPKLLNFTAVSGRPIRETPNKAIRKLADDVNVKFIVKKARHSHYSETNSDEHIIIDTHGIQEKRTPLTVVKDDIMYSASSINKAADTRPIKTIKTMSTPKLKTYSDETNANILTKLEKLEAVESSKVDKELYLQTMENQAKQIEEIKKLMMEKLANSNESNASTPSSSSVSSFEPQHVRVEKGPAMTKIQLFNGIRKYLNPTMVALLRMEMFGGSEREYRPDEKQLSKELYNLNQQVYEYMRDEWRFRLPSKSDVEVWLKDQNDEEIWELC